MKAEIITIGDELLLGQVIDTNSSWLGQELNKLGIHVHHKSAISDSREAILDALSQASTRSNTTNQRTSKRGRDSKRLCAESIPICTQKQTEERMDDVLLMGLVNFALCMWVLYLQHKLKTYRIALDGAFLMVSDLAEGKAVIEKTANGFSVRRIEDE